MKIRTLTELRELMESEVKPDRRMKAYEVSLDGLGLTFLLGAKNIKEARKLFQEQYIKSREFVPLREIKAKRVREKDELAQVPRAMWPNWYLGWEMENGEYYGWFHLLEEAE